MANGNGNFVSPIEILLVEDSPADVRLTKEALKEEKFKPLANDREFKKLP